MSIVGTIVLFIILVGTNKDGSWALSLMFNRAVVDNGLIPTIAFLIGILGFSYFYYTEMKGYMINFDKCEDNT